MTVVYYDSLMTGQQMAQNVGGGLILIVLAVSKSWKLYDSFFSISWNVFLTINRSTNWSHSLDRAFWVYFIFSTLTSPTSASSVSATEPEWVGNRLGISSVPLVQLWQIADEKFELNSVGSAHRWLRVQDFWSLWTCFDLV